MNGISRRYFFGLAATALRAQPPPRRKVLICLIDGLGPEYIAKSDMPVLKRLMREGSYREGTCMMPSLTNVNNASLATGVYPETHGITANTFYDPARKAVVEMADRSYLLAPTVFDHAHAKGLKTAFIGAKDKIRTLIGVAAQSNLCAEQQGIPMYEAANSYWIFERGREALRRNDVDLLYLTTTDYMMHTYEPSSAQSLEHLHKVDRQLGEIIADHPRLELYLCADHGMNAKTAAIDPVRILASQGIRARAVAAIADKHKVHHRDLGGSTYIDIEQPASIGEAQKALAAEPGIEKVLTRTEAARRFRLMPERTGDLFILADRDTALGELDSKRSEVKVRTHGSLHEAKVPLLVYGRKAGRLESIVDLTANRPWEDNA